jgi:hypothetical protein
MHVWRRMERSPSTFDERVEEDGALPLEWSKPRIVET